MVAVALGIVVTMLLRHMPEGRDHEHAPHVAESVKKLFANKRYISGVATQFFYVALQVSVWTYIIKYTREAAIISIDEAGKVYSCRPEKHSR
jgi:FHS family L-fucose permease-like MFS transporter